MVGRLAFAVPGDLATPTGGYAYDRRMIAELRRIGWQVDVIDLGDGFPFPTAPQRGAAFVALSSVPDNGPIVIDGLAFGVLPKAAAALQTRHPLIALVHHPLALESGLTPEAAAALRREREIRARLRSPRHRDQRDDRPTARRRFRRGGPSHHGRPPGTDPAPPAAGQHGRHRAAALRRLGDAAQRL